MSGNEEASPEGEGTGRIWRKRRTLLQSLGEETVGFHIRTALYEGLFLMCLIKVEKNRSEESVSHSVVSDSSGSSVHGILQAKILEWFAIPFSRGSS